MSFRMPGNGTEQQPHAVLRERARRFAGVDLEGVESMVHARPEPIAPPADEERLRARVDRFALRLGRSL